MTPEEAVRRLDEISGADPEGAHGEVDDILLALAGPEVAAAVRRVMGRCRWWACA